MLRVVRFGGRSQLRCCRRRRRFDAAVDVGARHTKDASLPLWLPCFPFFFFSSSLPPLEQPLFLFVVNQVFRIRPTDFYLIFRLPFLIGSPVIKLRADSGLGVWKSLLVFFVDTHDGVILCLGVVQFFLPCLVLFFIFRTATIVVVVVVMASLVSTLLGRTVLFLGVLRTMANDSPMLWFVGQTTRTDHIATNIISPKSNVHLLVVRCRTRAQAIGDAAPKGVFGDYQFFCLYEPIR